jgi:hypothetical protein
MHTTLTKSLARALAAACLMAATGAHAASGILAPSGATGMAAGAGAWALNFATGAPQPLNKASAAQSVTLTARSGSVVLYGVGTRSLDYKVVGSSCAPGLTLIAGTARDRCSFGVEFEPSRPGSRYGEVTIESNASSPTVVYLYGNAVAPRPAAETQIISITAPGSVAYRAGSTFQVSASSSAWLTPIHFSITGAGGVCSLGSTTPNGATVNVLASGTCTIVAAHPGDVHYKPASATASVSIAKTSQTVRFTPVTPIIYRNGGTFSLIAFASSGLTEFTYSSSTPTACTVSGTTATIMGAGTCTLTAKQAGNATYSSASATASVIINKANQTITFLPPSSMMYVPGRTFMLTAKSSSGLSKFSFSSGNSVCTVSGSTATMRSAGTCVLTASEPGNANFNPGKATANVVLSKG